MPSNGTMLESDLYASIQLNRMISNNAQPCAVKLEFLVLSRKYGDRASRRSEIGDTQFGFSGRLFALIKPVTALLSPSSIRFFRHLASWQARPDQPNPSSTPFKILKYTYPYRHLLRGVKSSPSLRNITAEAPPISLYYAVCLSR